MRNQRLPVSAEGLVQGADQDHELIVLYIRALWMFKSSVPLTGRISNSLRPSWSLHPPFPHSSLTALAQEGKNEDLDPDRRPWFRVRCSGILSVGTFPDKP